MIALKLVKELINLAIERKIKICDRQRKSLILRHLDNRTKKHRTYYDKFEIFSFLTFYPYREGKAGCEIQNVNITLFNVV